ncbi:MAG: Sodium/proton antiporter, partial [Candidatus Uhrbacteria bacterium GW2011_GWD2_52_7]
AQNGGNDDVAVVDDGEEPVAAPTTTTTKLSEAVNDEDHVRGDLKTAKVVMVEYSDFQCPYCERHHPTLEQVFDQYGDDIAWVYRHFPLSFHANAESAALASECAAEQGKFWEFADAMFDGQTGNLDGSAATASAFYTATAKDLGLNASKFESCVSSKKYQDKLDADMASGRASGVSGTPATFINGVLVTGSTGKSVGAAPASVFTSIIDAALAK